MKSYGAARDKASAIWAISCFLGHRNDDLSALLGACRNIMKRLQPVLRQENGRSVNSEVAQRPRRSTALSRPSLDEDSPRLPLQAPTSAAEALVRELKGGNKFLDDFEKELWELARSPPKARPSPGPPIEQEDKFLDDLEEAVQRFILGQDRKS